MNPMQADCLECVACQGDAGLGRIAATTMGAVKRPTYLALGRFAVYQRHQTNEMDREGLLDQAWLEDHASGWEELRASAAGQPGDKAALITGLAANDIDWLARTYSQNQPAAIRVLVGPEHREHGRDLMRASAILPAVTGAWRCVGWGRTQLSPPTEWDLPSSGRIWSR